MTQAGLLVLGCGRRSTDLSWKNEQTQGNKAQAKDLPRETRWWEEKRLGKKEVPLQERTGCAKWVTVEDSGSSSWAPDQL